MKLFTQFSNIRIVISGVILSSLVVGFFCISFMHTMSGHAGMNMSHLAPIGGVAPVVASPCCGKETGNHMELWKTTLVGIVETVQFLLVLFTVGLVATIAVAKLFGTPRLYINLFAARFRQYAREHPSIGLFDPNRLALAGGILNPKLY